jgi:hypothetical protein
LLMSFAFATTFVASMGTLLPSSNDQNVFPLRFLVLLSHCYKSNSAARKVSIA